MAARNQPPDIERILEESAAATFKRATLWIDGRFTEEISANKWNWDDGSTRDIVDQGRLRASQTRRENSDGSVDFTWPVEYANVVHVGGTRRNGVRFPGRPWTQAPLAELPEQMARLHADELRRRSR